MHELGWNWKKESKRGGFCLFCAGLVEVLPRRGCPTEIQASSVLAPDCDDQYTSGLPEYFPLESCPACLKYLDFGIRKFAEKCGNV